MHLKPLIFAGFIALAVASCGTTNKTVHMVTETYVVQSGDTLNGISEKYIEKSSVHRDIREFREGVICENWDTVFKDRYPRGMVCAGDRLQINYWKED